MGRTKTCALKKTSPLKGVDQVWKLSGIASIKMYAISKRSLGQNRYKGEKYPSYGWDDALGKI